MELSPPHHYFLKEISELNYPIQIPEATAGPCQPDTSLQPPEIECSDPEKPTEVRTRSGRLVKTPNRLIY
ncbi:hypothetical protein LAZ67_2001484 [Cordylochernes scorpioides]|uniref:Uncharacterized protein n=1 Tax=Cordylochernes scorpioides TaxID=51811 RepID=A0ABY6K606_9ARAC|nr:hypothetical protein LAZ67_2001484 [Cordylochernes scorpioides]